MLIRTVLVVFTLLFCGVIFSNHYTESKLRTLCPTYIDLVRPSDGLWNSSPVIYTNFTQWENHYDLINLDPLKLEKINGYEVLVPSGELSFVNLYSEKNSFQSSTVSLFENIYIAMNSANSGDTTWWSEYYSIFQLSNDFSNLDCNNLDYLELLNVTKYFEIYPGALSPGFIETEIIVDEDAKKILVITPIENEQKRLYDGMLIFVDRQNIVHMTVAAPDKEIVRASLIETAKILKKKGDKKKKGGRLNLP